MLKSIISIVLLGCFAIGTANAQTHPDSLTLAKQRATEEMMLRSAILLFNKSDSINQQPRVDTVASDTLLRPTSYSIWDRVVKREYIKDNTEKQGIVVLEVCLDSLGTVISADYKVKGSTTSDEHLISVSKETVRLWEFSTSTLERQCGTITFHFKLK